MNERMMRLYSAFCVLYLYLFCDDTFMWPSLNGNVLTNQIDIRSAKRHEVARCKQALKYQKTRTT